MPQPTTHSAREVPSLKASFAYRYRLQFTFACLMCGWAAALFTAPVIKQHSELDHQLDALAWTLLLSGLALRAWASHEISGKKKLVVVSTGPYALCRNPLYWGTFLIACSQLAFLRTMFFALVIVPLVLMYVFAVVPAEEQYLSKTIGVDYENYCRRTARWLPRWSGYSLGSSENVWTPAFRRELSSLACWFILPVIAETIGHVRELPNWPIFEVLY